jgi:hypothetical protein
MSELIERASVVAEARRWIGTPYRHGSDVRKGGVDCIMLLVRVYSDLGLVKVKDPRPYAPDWFLHRSEEIYIAGLEQYAHEVALPGPGDIVVWRYGRTFSHGGIVTSWETGARPSAPFGAAGCAAGSDRCSRQMVVHAYGKARIVEESDVSMPGPLNDPERPRRFFSLWGAGPAAAAVAEAA